SAARSCDTLLDKMTAEIGIDRTALGARDRLAQAPVVESLLTGEARKHPGHKYAHASSGFQSSIPLGVIMQGRRTIGGSEFSSQSKSTSVLRASCFVLRNNEIEERRHARCALQVGCVRRRRLRASFGMGPSTHEVVLIVGGRGRQRFNCSTKKFGTGLKRNSFAHRVLPTRRET